MENGAVAPKSECSIFHNIFKYIVFQRRYYGVKGLTHENEPVQQNGMNLSLVKASDGQKPSK